MVSQSGRTAEGRRLIGADTSAIRRYLEGWPAPDTTAVDAAIQNGELRVAPVVLLELRSDPNLPSEYLPQILALPHLELMDGIWERAGILRADMKRRVLKAGVADVLIAQSCIDHDIPLVTYDRDFRHFERVGLKLV